MAQQAIISSKGGDNDRPQLQGRQMQMSGARRTQQGTRQGAAAAGTDFQINNGSMFQFGADNKQPAQEGTVNLKMRSVILI